MAGDQDTYGLELTTSAILPVFDKHVFNIRGAFRVVDTYGNDDEVPVYDRLFLGGQRNIRGFDYRDVGPFDETGKEAIGGKSSYYTTFEYTVPLWKKIRGATFYDMGFVTPDAYDLDFGALNSGVGIGLRFDMPGMPLQTRLCVVRFRLKIITMMAVSLHSRWDTICKINDWRNYNEKADETRFIDSFFGRHN